MVAKKAADSSAPKKPVVPREDPVLRAERLLAEAVAKKAETSKRQLAGAEAELERANNQLARWQGLQERASAKVHDLRVASGLEVETPNEGQSYADALDDAVAE
jgi:flagellar biosynthesis chaperone FliJ